MRRVLQHRGGIGAAWTIGFGEILRKKIGYPPTSGDKICCGSTHAYTFDVAKGSRDVYCSNTEHDVRLGYVPVFGIIFLVFSHSAHPSLARQRKAPPHENRLSTPPLVFSMCSKPGLGAAINATFEYEQLANQKRILKGPSNRYILTWFLKVFIAAPTTYLPKNESTRVTETWVAKKSECKCCVERANDS